MTNKTPSELKFIRNFAAALSAGTLLLAGIAFDGLYKGTNLSEDNITVQTQSVIERRLSHQFEEQVGIASRSFAKTAAEKSVSMKPGTPLIFNTSSQTSIDPAIAREEAIDDIKSDAANERGGAYFFSGIFTCMALAFAGIASKQHQQLNQSQTKNSALQI